MIKRILTKTLFLLGVTSLIAQGNHSYWQQHVDYTMSIDMDVTNYKYNGKQVLEYTNNSPDVLHKVFLSFTLLMPFSRTVKWMRDYKLFQILTDEWPSI